MNWSHLTLVFYILIFNLFSPVWAVSNSSHKKADPVPVQVKVTAVNANWVTTISICNTSSSTIPLTNIELDFNYAAIMPPSIWGQPWAAWQVASQNGSAVVLQGGTPYTPSLPPDPNCTNPLTVQFNAAPNSPIPTAPFTFKAEGGQPVGSGSLNITLAVAPAGNLPNPTITIAGNNASQQKAVTWGTSWLLSNLVPGTYTINPSSVDNGVNYYTSGSAIVNVSNQQTTHQIITYKLVPSGTVAIKLLQAPSTQVQLIFTGKTYTLTKNVTNGASVTLPKDTYTVSSNAPGYTAVITPNPITIPGTASLSITYTPIQNSSGPYTTVNGQIVDKNKKPVNLKGVNWFGFNTGNHILHGLWQSDFDTMLKQIKAVGFNAVRIPFQFDFILDPTIVPSSITTTCNGNPCNTDVPQDSALHAFQWVVKQFTDNGLFVLLDDHYEDLTYVNNQAQWIAGWKKVAQMFADNPSVAYDLYNEPDAQGLLWDTGKTPWAQGITSATEAIYAIDTVKLIFIEGVGQSAIFSNWGDGFATDNATVAQGISNPKNFFTQLLTKPYLNQMVISPHAYGPDGTNNQGPDHSNQTKAWADWSRLDGYLMNNFLNVNNTSVSGFCLGSNCHSFPVVVGEFGGKFDSTDPYYTQDTETLINLANYINRLGQGQPIQPSWFYWDWNPDSGNTGGILENDWTTIDCNKVNYLKKYLQLQPAANICS